MRKPSIPRAVARTATAAALAGAVTVPTLGSTPVFASSTASSTTARPTSSARTVPHFWVYNSSYQTYNECADAGRASGRNWSCRYDPSTPPPWDLYLWF